MKSPTGPLPGVAEFFGASGPLSRCLEGYAPREGQVRMAEAVARTLGEGGVLLAEAGTGTGKTLAYLVPALLSGRKVVVSTATKTLQSQILEKEVPQLITSVAKRTMGTLIIPYGDKTIDLTPPWPRIPMLEALLQKGVPPEVLNNREKAKEWARTHSIETEGDVSLGKILDEIFKELVEPGLVQPTFITDYPVELAPLAKKKEGNPELTERFELFIASQKIANAFSELTIPLTRVSVS